MDDRERLARLEQLAAYRDRIRILERRQAQLGPAFTTAQELELSEARNNADVLRAELELDTILPETPSSRHLSERVLLLEQGARNLEKSVQDAFSAINFQLGQIRDNESAWRDAERQVRTERQQLADARHDRLEAIVTAMLAGIAVFALFALLALYIASR